MANKAKLKKEMLLRLAEERYLHDLQSRQERKSRRRWATRREQRIADERRALDAKKEEVTKAVRTKLKSESKKKLERIKERKSVIDLPVPEVLDLFAEYDKTANFLNQIRTIALKQRRNLRLVFDNTQLIHPGAVICLVSEIYRCRKIETNRKRVDGTYPKNARVRRILQDIGFFELIDVQNPLPPAVDNYPMDYIKVFSGVRAVGEEADRLKYALLGDAIKMNPGASGKLYRGLTEAMTNVVHHAYPKEIRSRLPRLKNRWWLVGHVDKEQRELMVMFFDQGVGIPTTLPLRYPEYLGQILSGLRLTDPNDGDLIRAAMRVRRSQTLEAHRGHGLNDFRAFIDQCGGGSLRIVSRRGLYSYTSDGTEESHGLRISLGGTLIEWKVPLEKISNWRGD